MKKKRKVLALLGWHDPRIIYGIGRFALKAGWHLESRCLFSDVMPTGWRGDGMLVSRSERPQMRQFVRRQAKLQPTVLLGANNPGIEAPCIRQDDRAIGRLAAEHLLTRGHKNLVWFNVFHGNTARDRRDGFIEAAGHTQCHCVCLEKFGPLTKPFDWGARRSWLLGSLRRLGKPCGLFAVDDQLAAEAIEACLDAGFRVPDDVSVVGVGNLDLASAASPVPLSSVEICEEETAYRAAATLDRLMDGKLPPHAPIFISPREVVSRKSSDFLAISHPVLQLAVEYMQYHYAKPLTMVEIAQAADISRRTLYSLFTTELRISPAAYLLRVRMEHAKRLLVETDRKIGSIATLCGLQSRRNINRCFWRLEQMAPREWRRCHRATGALSSQPPSPRPHRLS